MKAVIGINVDIEGTHPKKATIQANYYESIARAGGIPILIPPGSNEDLACLLRLIDGVLFIGGNDYCPSFYGEEKQATVELAHDDRLDFDYRLLKLTLASKRMPVLGICAGCQILNIGLGGNLHQDIHTDFPASTIQHTSKNGWNKGFHKHKVFLQEGSKLSGIYSQKEFDVPTSHHQSVKSLGTGLAATANAADGIIEAVELVGHDFVIGVQWHPERDYAVNQELFSAFVKAALAYNESSKRR